MPKIESLYIEVCVFKYVDGIPSYLILQRSDTEKVYPCLFQFITGVIEKKMDGEPETAIEAALREINEEINISPQNFWTVPYINSFYVPQEDIVNVSPLFLAEVSENSIVTLSDEHQSFEWLEYSDAIERLTWPGQKKGLEIINNFLCRKENWGEKTKIN